MLSMPLLANKPYILNKIRKDKKEDNSIFYHPLTNEICDSDEELTRKTFLYNQKIWTCRITCQTNLTFKEAQRSEHSCSKTLKNSVKKCFEPIILQYVHHNRESLENIIHKAWTQMHEEFCINEPVVIKLPTPTQSICLKGIVVKVDKSIQVQNAELESSLIKIISDASSSDKENTKRKIIPLKKNYHYSVKLFDMDKLVNDIPAETIERTLRPPSKDQIKMFIRAHATRQPGKQSHPWVVDEDFVKKYKLPNTEPDFIPNKLKMKEVSHALEIQIYNKMIEDLPTNGDTNNSCLSICNGVPETEQQSKLTKKKAPKKLIKENGHSKLVKPKSTKKPSIISTKRAVPALAQQLLRVMTEDKGHFSVNQLLMKCCKFSDAQISRLPEIIRAPIKEKKEKIELRKKLRNMTQEEKRAFMAARRVELRQLRKDKMRNSLKTEEDDSVYYKALPEGSPLPLIGEITHDQWARLLSVSEFVRCFKGVLGTVRPEQRSDLNVNDLCRAVIGDNDGEREMLADLVCIFLKPLLQDNKCRKRKEFGVSVCELPVTACTASEILRLILPTTEARDEDDEGKEIERTDQVIVTHNNTVIGPICEKLENCELHDLTVEEKVAVLELLQTRILELDIINTFIEENQRDASEACKKRQMDNKELQDRMKALRSEIAETIKLKTNATANARNKKEILDNVQTPTTKRRMSLELKNKEAEEQERLQDIERTLLRLEKEEAACRLMIDQKNDSCGTMMSDSRDMMRVQPLGIDRHDRRYWWFRTAGSAVFQEAGHVWAMYRDLGHVQALIDCLSDCSPTEGALKKRMHGLLPRLEKAVDEEETSEAKVAGQMGEDFLVRGFKEELRETEANIRQGSLGGVLDDGSWSLSLSSATSLDQMGQSLLMVYHSVNDRFWSMSADHREHLIASIGAARTQSRLNVLQCVLDGAVCWSKFAIDDKCRLCRKGHRPEALLLCDGCNLGYHMFCVRPPLRRVPAGEWLCGGCRPKGARAQDQSGDQEDGSMGLRSRRACAVCQGANGDQARCTDCGRWFHAGCHEPPLRRVPRGGGWACGRCRVSLKRRPSSEDGPAPKRPRHSKDQDQVGALLAALQAHKWAGPFAMPVDPDEAPDYLSVISTPVDLSLIDERHSAGRYTEDEGGVAAFLADVGQMFANAELYNEPGSGIVRMSRGLEAFFRREYRRSGLGPAYLRGEATYP